MHPVPSPYEIYYHSCIDAMGLYQKLCSDKRTVSNNMFLNGNSIQIDKGQYYMYINFPYKQLEYYNLKTPFYCWIHIFSRIPNHMIKIRDFVDSCKRIEIESYDFENVISELNYIFTTGIGLEKLYLITDVCPNFYKN